MTTPEPAQPQPRDIALEQPTPDQLETLEAASEPGEEQTDPGSE